MRVHLIDRNAFTGEKTTSYNLPLFSKETKFMSDLWFLLKVGIIHKFPGKRTHIDISDTYVSMTTNTRKTRIVRSLCLDDLAGQHLKTKILKVLFENLKMIKKARV